MNSNNCRILIILFLLIVISKISSQGNKYISIPFSFKYINNISNYNSTNFFNDFFERILLLKFNIGTPSQQINAIIDQNSECIRFQKDKSDDYFNDNYRYYPIQSSSFSKTKNTIIFYPYFEEFSDIFNFPEINKSYLLEFLVDNNDIKLSNISYLPIIGLNIPISYTGIKCPNLISNFKKEGIIDKLIWSLKYNNEFGGYFVIGDELSAYEPIKYPESNYSTIYLNSKYTIFFDVISILDKWPKTNNKNKNNNIQLEINLNQTEVFININSGVIIGTSEYKKYIDDKIFNALIKKSFCKIDIINYNNSNEKKFNNDYYIYSCYDRFFTGKIDEIHYSIDYYNYFPSLLLTSKKLEYIFELINKDLFKHISDRYYFLVIFKKNINLKEKEIWYLGEPFYKKYSFSINLDAKTIGFYIEKDKNLFIKDRNNNIDKQNKNKEDNNKEMNKIIKIIIEIIIIIGITFLAFYIGITVKERRKKRANELKDDNYEYLSEKDKNINNHSKYHQIVELNSRLGV